MTVNINDLPFDAVLYLVGEIDAVSDNPTVTFRWEENNQGPYINDGTTETLATELICTGSAQQRWFWWCRGVLFDGWCFGGGETRQVQYTTTKRGVPNGETNNPPTTNDTGRYREHKNNSVWLLSEVISIKNLQSTFTSTTNTFVKTRNGSEDVDDVVYLNSSDEAVIGLDGNGRFFGIITERDGESVTIARYNASGITVPGSIGDSIYWDDTGEVFTTTATDNTFVGTKVTSDSISILPEAVIEFASQAEAEAGTDENKVYEPFTDKTGY